jgi:hypothetical protein
LRSDFSDTMNETISGSVFGLASLCLVDTVTTLGLARVCLRRMSDRYKGGDEKQICPRMNGSSGMSSRAQYTEPDDWDGTAQRDLNQ